MAQKYDLVTTDLRSSVQYDCEWGSQKFSSIYVGKRHAIRRRTGPITMRRKQFLLVNSKQYRSCNLDCDHGVLSVKIFSLYLRYFRAKTII